MCSALLSRHVDAACVHSLPHRTQPTRDVDPELCVTSEKPAFTQCWNELILGQHRRWWTIIKPTFTECLVFAEHARSELLALH